MEPLVIPFSGNSSRECAVNLARAFCAKRACKRAARVIAVSEFVRRYVSERWKVPPGSVGLVYHGAERPPAAHQAIRPSSIPDGMRGRFLFTAGSIRPARGLEDAVQALALVGGLPFELLVIGGAVPPGARRYRERIAALAKDAGVASRVVWAGHLGRLEMSWCFYNCSAFVMTSRTEACPNVVLEAMAHGCLCVSTDSPPMPEFFDDAALYYPAGDAPKLAGGLDQIMAGEEEACRLRKRAVERSLLYTWENTARRTVDELERALN
jgi:glycosyltransferase involved in cell wall biosynthesis